MASASARAAAMVCAACASASWVRRFASASARPSISVTSSSARRSIDLIRSVVAWEPCLVLASVRTCARSFSARTRASSSSLASCTAWASAASRSVTRMLISASSLRRWASTCPWS
jgi:hypothetical protein